MSGINHLDMLNARMMGHWYAGEKAGHLFVVLLIVAGMALAERTCTSCGQASVSFGEAGDDGAWISLYCRACSFSGRGAAEDVNVERGQAREGLVKLSGRCRSCKRRATFGQKLQGALRCKRHKVDGDVDTSNRRCHSQGCGRQPSFGEESTGVAVSCAKHKKETFVNLKGRLCRHPEGCSKLASFGLERGIPLVCAEHKSYRHVALTLRAMCQAHGCGKQSTFGDQASRISMFCKLHKRQKDVDLQGGRCQYAEGCEKWAMYGNTTQPRFCRQHRADGQVTLRHIFAASFPDAQSLLLCNFSPVIINLWSPP